MTCPACEVEALEGSRFCETCGAKLISEAVSKPATCAPIFGACRCGGSTSDTDENGFCNSCGLNLTQLIRDHHEEEVSTFFAAVTDRGIRHVKNEDDFAIGIETGANGRIEIIVVCDGLSSAANSDVASSLACETAKNSLSLSVQLGGDEYLALKEAIYTAHQAVCDLPNILGSSKAPPSATLVAAIVSGHRIMVGWVGDSRAYWISEFDSVQLTRDHSWVNEVVDSGVLTEEQALNSRQAHAITQCLGRLEDESEVATIEPSFVTFSAPSEGWLALVSDGLWNYASKPEEMKNLFPTPWADADALTICRNLIEFARKQGGRDNITAAALRISP